MSEVENFCPYMCDHSSMCFSGHVKLNLSQHLGAQPPDPASRFSYHLSLRPWYHHASSYTTAWHTSLIPVFCLAYFFATASNQSQISNTFDNYRIAETLVGENFGK